MIAAKNETPTPFGGRWPRGAERRHFRGGAAVKTVAGLQQRYGARPEDMVAFPLHGPLDIRSGIARAQSPPPFRPWVAFQGAAPLAAVLRAQGKQGGLP